MESQAALPLSGQGFPFLQKSTLDPSQFCLCWLGEGWEGGSQSEKNHLCGLRPLLETRRVSFAWKSPRENPAPCSLSQSPISGLAKPASPNPPSLDKGAALCTWSGRRTGGRHGRGEGEGGGEREIKFP